MVAWAVRGAALYTVLDIVLPEHGSRHLSRTMDALSDGTAFAAGMITAASMLLVAGALRRRKYRAWVFMLFLTGVGLVANVQIHRFRVVALHVALLGLLVWARRDFTARSQPRSRLAAVRVLLVMGSFSMAAGYLLVRRTAVDTPWCGCGKSSSVCSGSRRTSPSGIRPLPRSPRSL